MNEKIFTGISMKQVHMVLVVCVAQVLLLSLVSSGNVYAQDWAITRSWNSTNSASATPVRNAPNVPSTLSIQLNTLLQQRSALQQQVTVAQRCVKNNTLNEVLRDPEGNRRVVPSTDVINCLRTLNGLNRLLVSNQQAINNLNQDAQFRSLQIMRKRDKATFDKRQQAAFGDQ
jgi:hypothetical protein